ncbi:hypothetical protein SAMD00019534_028840 [Acytostelium subglobosum LB1]|uniref:hypothetical protein n=1 Tax=Acytostelium subglobosum LB1 TaxID=1410327 RepID=UPI0006447ECA|nr:hypothetical protein SAMD00019534_028840 [Acytostelium subglobosum LB1]GAM19709.1 hypothetical protein SAMD00019534_028840 [Acytostelium subglobosum LB1]|eukprot:XP_012756471.1 hypothetical protein SAMD00019534_028840 [Acytostelium subglobosum LB1]
MRTSLSLVLLLVALISIAVVSTQETDAAEGTKDYVIDLTDDDKSLIKDGFWLVEFFAPWCGYCKRLAPVWSELSAHVFRNEIPVKIAKVNCDENKSLCGDHEVRGYPTIKLFLNGTKKDYKGQRTKTAFIQYLEKMLGGYTQTVHDKSGLNGLLKSDPYQVSYIYLAGESINKASDPLYTSFKHTAFELFDQGGPNFIEIEDETLLEMKVSGPMVLLFKDDRFQTFSQTPSHLPDWMRQHRFPTLSKVTDVSFGPLSESFKYLVLFAHETQPAHDEIELMKKVAKIPMSDDPQEFGYAYVVEYEYGSWLKRFNIEKYPAVLVIQDQGDIYYYDPLMRRLDDVTVPKFLKEVQSGSVEMKYTDAFRFYYLRTINFISTYLYYILAAIFLIPLLIFLKTRGGSDVNNAAVYKGDKVN